MPNSLQTIAVDLTPIRPGGENGGAKLFIFELIARLTELAPTTQFVLLTHESAFEELRQLERANVSCQIVSRAVGKKSFFARGVGYILRRLPRIPPGLSGWAYQLHAHARKRAAKSILQTIKPDLLFCPLTAPTYSMPGLPTVCTIYDLQFKTYPSFFDLTDRLHREHTFRDACKQATMLVAISEYTRQSVLAHSAYHPHRIHTVLLRFAHRLVETEPSKTILSELGLQPQQYLLYPANYWLHKNHEMLLTAFRIACQNESFPSNIKLLCTGAPNKHQQWLKDAALRMNLGARVHFADYLTHAELATLMQQSCGLVFPSLYEGFGLPVLEAMAVNIPVACSNTRSLPEVAGEAALFFDPRVPTQIAEAMIRLVTDHEKRQHLIQKGQERVSLFSDSLNMAAEYWHIFQQSYHLNHHPEKIA